MNRIVVGYEQNIEATMVMQPVNVPDEQRTHVPVAGEQEETATLSIVFLQHDPLLAETYRIKLELDGYQVTLARPTNDALNDLRARPPDIIFLDASSGAKSDPAVLSGLRNDLTISRIPVLILSSRTADELAADGMRLGPLDYLVHCQ
jgi:DNA-binding response OmpR family regulator